VVVLNQPIKHVTPLLVYTILKDPSIRSKIIQIRPIRPKRDRFLFLFRLLSRPLVCAHRYVFHPGAALRPPRGRHRGNRRRPPLRHSPLQIEMERLNHQPLPRTLECQVVFAATARGRRRRREPSKAGASITWSDQHVGLGSCFNPDYPMVRRKCSRKRWIGYEMIPESVKSQHLASNHQQPT
jgi:hypothetical protein